jgi:hypothetical protein
MSKQSGTSFLEILISLVIMSVMLSGVNLMLLESLRKTQVAYEFSVAIQQLNFIAEILVSRKTISMSDMNESWNKQVSKVLPEGRGLIEGRYPDYSVSIFWGNFNGRACNKMTIERSGCLRIYVRSEMHA